MNGRDILHGILKKTIEISHKISRPHIRRYEFDTALKSEKLLDLRAHTCF